MRVLMDYRAALRERSGVGEYTHELAAALLTPPARTAAPIALTLFSSSWKDRLAADLGLPSARVVDRRIPVSVLNFAWHRLQWPPAELLAGGPFDVAHSLHPLLMPARAAAQVITVHDLNFLRHPERTRAEVRRDYPSLARAHAQRADHVIVVSRFTAREVEQHLDVPADRISVCSPGAPRWAPRATEPRDGYVLFFGTLEPRKNVGGLLDAYELLAGRGKALAPLVLAGKAPVEAAPWLARIHRPPLEGLVRHIGYVDPAHRRALYEGAVVLVQPSFEEGFGLPVLEAMTTGVPVIAADRGALPEVVGDAGTLVDPTAPDAIADALQQLLEHAEARAAASSRGIERARLFSWEETARRTMAAYEAALGRRARRNGAA